MVDYDKILEDLQRRTTGKPELAESVALYTDLIAAQSRVVVSPIEPAVLAPDAPARLQQGLPILAPDKFHANPGTLVALCNEICAITARHRAELSGALDAIRVWLDREPASILTVVVEYLHDEEDVRLGEIARSRRLESLMAESQVGEARAREQDRLDDSLLVFVLNHALHPFLRRYAQVLAPLVDESLWYRPRCPICGGKPDFAALTKETGARRLLCSRCDCEWAFRRVGCPFCGSDDPETQKYVPSDDRVYRLALCEQCKGYLKTIDLREAAGERFLPVERILTIGMDVAAREAGYAVAL